MLHRRSVLLAGLALLLARGRAQAQINAPSRILPPSSKSAWMSPAKRMGFVSADHRRRPAQRHRLRALRHRSPARCRHGIRDRLDHKSAHLAVAGRHGAAGRGGDGRPCLEISTRQRQDAGFRGRADHAAGSRDLHVGPAADAVQFRAKRSAAIPTSITPPSGSTTTCRTTSSASSRASTYEYSNLGFGLLGHILELRGGKSYEDLVVSRICAPLGMDDTRITLSSSMQQRLARATTRVSRRSRTGIFGARRRRRVSFDGERSAQVSPDVPGPRKWACRRRAEDGACRASPGPVSATWRRLVCRFPVRRRSGVEGGGTGGYATFIGYSTRTRRNCILLSKRPTMPPIPRSGRTWSTRHTRCQNFTARCRSIRRCSPPMPAATKYRRPSS